MHRTHAQSAQSSGKLLIFHQVFIGFRPWARHEVLESK